MRQITKPDLEQKLVEIWRTNLNLTHLDVNDDFLELGGNSILAIRMANQLQRLLGESVHNVTLFEHRTIADLASFLLKHYMNSIPRLFNDGTDRQVMEERSESTLQRVSKSNLKVEVQTKKCLTESTIAAARQMLADGIGSQREIDPDTPKNPRAIFILCSPRSGSTLLRVMLAGHPNLFAPPELFLLPFTSLGEKHRTFSEARRSLVVDGLTRAIMQLEHCELEAAQKIVDEFEKQNLTTKQVYHHLQARLGDRLLVDKTPYNSMYPAFLERAERYFHQPVYIHLTRHPFGMIRSFERSHLDIVYNFNHPFSTREAAELVWVLSYQNILEFLKNIPVRRQHQLKFEELVANPQAEMVKLCQTLCLDFHDEMIQPYKEKKIRMTDTSSELSGMIGDINFHEHSQIDSQVADRWQVEIKEDFLGETTWKVADMLGYSRDLPVTGEKIPMGKECRDDRRQPAVVDASLLSLSAEEKLRRIDRLSDEEVDALWRQELDLGEE